MPAEQILRDVNCTSVLKKIFEELVQVKRSHPETYEAILNLLSDLRDVDLDESGVQASFKSDRQNLIVEYLDNASLSVEPLEMISSGVNTSVNNSNTAEVVTHPPNEISAASTSSIEEPQNQPISQAEPNSTDEEPRPADSIVFGNEPQSADSILAGNESQVADPATHTYSPVDKLMKSILAWDASDIRILSKEYQMLISILKNMTTQLPSRGHDVDGIVKLFYELEILDSVEKWVSSLKAVRYLQFLSATKKLMEQNSINRVTELIRYLVDSGRLKATESKKFKSRITKCEKISKVVTEIGSGIVLIKGLQWSLVYKLNESDLNDFIEAIRLLPIADSLRSVQENGALQGIFSCNRSWNSHMICI